MDRIGPNAADLEMNPFLNAHERSRFAAYAGAIEGAYLAGGTTEGPIAATRIIDTAMMGHWEHPMPVHDMFRSSASFARKRAERTAIAKN